MLLITSSGEYAGLLAGGCLEGDLVQRAVDVIETGRARLITYDLRNPDDMLWGLGAGCEGVMDILLLRVGPQEQWQPLEHLVTGLETPTPTAFGVVTESTYAPIPAGTLVLPGSQGVRTVPSLNTGAEAGLLANRLAQALTVVERSVSPGWIEEPGRWKAFLLPLVPPVRLLLLGAGPDARPVADLAARLHWKVTLVDHRPAYAITAHFPSAERVIQARPEELNGMVSLPEFSAAVVMSHHLPSDLQYLRTLAASPSPAYVGLLGPRARREKLLAQLGANASLLRDRLHAPVGLKLGGRSPEAIALSILAEIQLFTQGAKAPATHSSPG